MTNNLKQFKEWECNCRRCQKMCDRPCFGTVEDIKKLIEAGHSDRLCLDWNSAPSDEEEDIPFLTPALKDHEGKLSPAFPQSKKGCTFYKDGLCHLHSLKLKPLQGRTAIHAFNDEKLNKSVDKQHDEVKEYIMQDWKSKQGQDLVDSWCKEHGIESKERVLDHLEFIDQYGAYYDK